MSEIVLFHHAGGLTDGVLAFADRLRTDGHSVHTPDLFDGRTFPDVHDGVAYADAMGEETFAALAAEFVSGIGLAGVWRDVNGCSAGGRAGPRPPGRPGCVLP